MTTKLKLSLPAAGVIGQRLKHEMKKRDMSATALARHAHVKTSFLYDVLSGKSANPSTVKLARVAEALGVNLTYLAGASENPLAEAPPAIADTGQAYVVVQRLMADSGGSAMAAQEYPEERVCFSRAWIERRLGVAPSSLRMLNIRDDSMEPTLRLGDVALVDTTKRTPSPPGVFALFDGFGLMAKRLEYAAEPSPQQLRILSDNPHYSAYERPVDEILIIGRVVWFSREM